MTIHRSPLEQDPTYIPLLGVIAARWAMMESLLEHLLGIFFDDDILGSALYQSQGGLRQRIEMLKGACNACVNPESRGDYIDVLVDIYDLFKARNKMIHTPYHLVVEGEYGLRVTQRMDGNRFRVHDGDRWWIGHGPSDDPTRLNKGVFNNHLEALDQKIDRLLTLMIQLHRATRKRRIQRQLQHERRGRLSRQGPRIQRGRVRHAPSFRM